MQASTGAFSRPSPKAAAHEENRYSIQPVLGLLFALDRHDGRRLSRRRRAGADWSVSPPASPPSRALKPAAPMSCSRHSARLSGPCRRARIRAVVHFAQINEMDGFSWTGREADPDFSWDRLEGAEVVLFGGGQPLAMFKFACHKAGIDYDKLNAIHPGNAAEIDRAFRAGDGPVCPAAGAVPPAARSRRRRAMSSPRSVCRSAAAAFSSLCARPDWLETDMARAFTRAYRKTRRWLNETPAAEVARVEKDWFPEIDLPVLERCIATYRPARLLGAAYRDHAAGLRGDAGYLRLERPDRRALRLRPGSVPSPPEGE